MTAQDRAAMIEKITAEEQDTKTRAAVAGFDLTFSVPKSVSALGALGDHPLQEQLHLAHRAAMTSTIELVEAEALLTRTGRRSRRIASIVDGVTFNADILENRRPVWRP